MDTDDPLAQLPPASAFERKRLQDLNKLATLYQGLGRKDRKARDRRDITKLLREVDNVGGIAFEREYYRISRIGGKCLRAFVDNVKSSIGIPDADGI